MIRETSLPEGTKIIIVFTDGFETTQKEIVLEKKTKIILNDEISTGNNNKRSSRRRKVTKKKVTQRKTGAKKGSSMKPFWTIVIILVTMYAINWFAKL